MTGRGASGMDTGYRSRLVGHLLALKDAPDMTLLDRCRRSWCDRGSPHAVRRGGPVAALGPATAMGCTALINPSTRRQASVTPPG